MSTVSRSVAGIVSLLLVLVGNGVAVAAPSDSADPPAAAESLASWSGPSAESIVAAPGSSGFWTGFSGVGVRGVLGAPDLWSEPSAGASSQLASNQGGIVVPNLSGSGYWVVSSSGLVFEFGGAPEICGRSLSSCVSGYSGHLMAAAAVPNHPGGGFWVVNDNGKVFGTPGVPTYGDWTNGGHVPVALVASPTGLGYYILEKDGGIAAKGDAVFYGAGRNASAHEWTGMALSLDSAGAVNGYWTITRDGTLYPYPTDTMTRHGYAGNSSLDASDGTVVGMAATAAGDGFAVMQMNGQVTVFPAQGTAPVTTRNTQSVEGGGSVPQPGKFTFDLSVRNESSRSLNLVPHTSASTDPRSNGSGFTSAATSEFAALPVAQTVKVSAGSTSATWPVTAEVFTDSPSTVQLAVPAQIQMDVVPTTDAVSPVTDNSDRHRVSIAQPRQSITLSQKSVVGSEQIIRSNYQLLSGPDTSVVGSGSLSFRLDQTIDPTGDTAGTWTLVITNAPEPVTSTEAGDVPITRLSAPYVEDPLTSEWSYLKNPIFRVDIPPITKTWDGKVPGRIVVQPATVSEMNSGRVLGTLVPTSAPSFDPATNSVTYGQASFYYQLSAPDEMLRITGGWVGQALQFGQAFAFPNTAAALPVAPAGTILSGLALTAGAGVTNAGVPNNGVGALQARLSVSNNTVVVPADGSLGWLYNHMFFLDATGNLITGLNTGQATGYAAVSPTPARQVSSGLESASPNADVGAGSAAKVWLTSTEEAFTTGTVTPVLSVLIEKSDGTGSISANLSAASQLSYKTFSPYGSTLSGDLSSGVGVNCSSPTGSYACAPTFLSVPASQAGKPALYRGPVDGNIWMVTSYDALQSQSDKSPPDTPVLGMFESAIGPNAVGSATLASPPALNSLPSDNQNPLFTMSLVAPTGMMVVGDVTLEPRSLGESAATPLAGGSPPGESEAALPEVPAFGAANALLAGIPAAACLLILGLILVRRSRLRRVAGRSLGNL